MLGAKSTQKTIFSFVVRKRERRKPLSFCTSTSTPPFVNENVTKKMQKTLDREPDMSYISIRAKRKNSLTKEHKMIDYVVVCTPHEEKCAQVGSDNYLKNCRKECRVLAGQIFREFGRPPKGASLGIKTFHHDFGEYYELCVTFDDENDDAINYAFELESHQIDIWDIESRKELGI